MTDPDPPGGNCVILAGDGRRLDGGETGSSGGPGALDWRFGLGALDSRLLGKSRVVMDWAGVSFRVYPGRGMIGSEGPGPLLFIEDLRVRFGQGSCQVDYCKGSTLINLRR